MNRRQRILNKNNMTKTVIKPNQQIEEPIKEIDANKIAEIKPIEEKVPVNEIKPLKEKKEKKEDRNVVMPNGYTEVQTIRYTSFGVNASCKKISSPQRILEEIFHRALTIEKSVINNELVELYDTSSHDNFYDCTDYKFTSLLAGTCFILNFDKFMAGFIVEKVQNPNSAKNNSISITYEGYETDFNSQNCIFCITDDFAFRFQPGVKLREIASMVDLENPLPALNVNHTAKKVSLGNLTTTAINLLPDDVPKEGENGEYNSYAGIVSGYFFLTEVYVDNDDTFVITDETKSHTLISRCDVNLQCTISGETSKNRFLIGSLLEGAINQEQADYQAILKSNSSSNSLIPKLTSVYQNTFGDSYAGTKSEDVTSNDVKIFMLKKLADAITNED